MGTLVLAGATSGSATLTPVDAVTATITLPSATATLATLGANTFTGNQAITGTLGVTEVSSFAAGAVGAPSIYLGGDTTTGLYRIGANNDGFAVSGAKVLDIASTGLSVTGALTSSSTFSVVNAATFNVTSGGYLTAIGSYNTTTPNPANVQIDGAGNFNRSTSALKYKHEIRDLELIDVNLFRPVRYKPNDLKFDQSKDYIGIIADEVEAAGIPELVTYGNDGEVEGFAYERLTVVLLKAVQDLTARLAAMEAK